MIDATQDGENTQEAGAAKTGGTTAPARPMFFQRLEILDADRHGDLKFRESHDYGFARDTHMIPLNAVEFMAAARHYPILFNGDSSGMPVVLVGVRSAQNLFVEPDGSWTTGCYVPAFVRRYPFVLLRGKDSGGKQGGGVRLGIDVDAGMVGAEDGSPLFSDGTPTEIMKRMGRFCGAFAREQARTRKFVDACRDLDLLVEREVNVDLANGRTMAIRGFSVIDEERLRAIPEDCMAEWWRSGWFALAVAHIVSLGNFGRLFSKDERSYAAPMDFNAG